MPQRHGGFSGFQRAVDGDLQIWTLMACEQLREPVQSVGFVFLSVTLTLREPLRASRICACPLAREAPLLAAVETKWHTHAHAEPDTPDRTPARSQQRDAQSCRITR